MLVLFLSRLLHFRGMKAMQSQVYLYPVSSLLPSLVALKGIQVGALCAKPIQEGHI